MVRNSGPRSIKSVDGRVERNWFRTSPASGEISMAQGSHITSDSKTKPFDFEMGSPPSSIIPN